MPEVFETKQHMRAATQEKKRAKLLEEIDEMCARARETAKKESNLRKVMSLHSRCKILVNPRPTVNNDTERARKREGYHRRRKELLESRESELV